VTATSAPDRVRSLLPAAELALGLVTLSVVFGLNRLFADGSFFAPLFWIVVGGHMVASLCRRRGLGLGVSAVLSAVGLAVVVGWVLYPETTTFGVPGGATLDAARTDLSTVWTLFQAVAAPAPVENGFILVAAIAVWACTYIADWAAFRLWVPFEAVVPAGTVFVFGALLGAPPHRTVATLAFLLTVVGFLLVHRVASQQTSSSWLTSDVGRGSASLLKVGSTLGLFAVVLGVAGGPLLPGADATAAVPWRDIDTSSGARKTVSPLVQIKGRLVDQSNTEMFTVRSTERAYWRLTALDTFDGDVWSSKGSYGQESGDLADADQFQGEADSIHQHYEIDALAAIWLPAAFEARSIGIEDVKVRWEPESATLIVDTRFDDSDGFEYDIDSASPRFEPDVLTAAAAGPGIPGSIADRYLDLPDDFSARVGALAGEITQSARTPYGKALALQNWFRENFRYTLDAPSGHSDSAIEQFLFETQAGYCEQFAGSYAAMARAIGLPSRVAVGFTPGEEDAEEPGLYHVLGKHAHAWPEVFLGSVGWVAFEPTPGRGQPAAQSYTGIPEQQVDRNDPSTATTVATATGNGEISPSTGSLSTTTLDLEGPDTGAVGTGTPQERDGYFVRMWHRWGSRFLWTLAGLAAAAVLYAIGVPTAAWLRRRRRRGRAVDPGDQVRVAWTESVEAMAVVGVTPRPSETLAEFAGRAGHRVDGTTYPELATTVEEAEYSEVPVTQDNAARAFELSQLIQRSVQQQATREQRVRAALDPRPLLPRRAVRRRVRYDEGSTDQMQQRVRAGV